MLTLRYYWQGKGKQDIRKLLADIEAEHGIGFEISDLSSHGSYDEESEKRVYERDFKPRARILKRRTGEAITRLRSHKAGHYFVSRPGTIAVLGDDGQVEWYTLGDRGIAEFLRAVLHKGYASLEERCQRAQRG